MVKTNSPKQFAIVFVIPIVLLLTLVGILNAPHFFVNQPQLYSYITIDFVITIPLVYFLLIRKRNISKLSVAPVLIVCIVIASYFIPEDRQQLLQLAKTWLIPIVEIGVLSLVIFNVRKAVKHYRNTSDSHEDFYTAIVHTCESMFPKIAAKLVANEIALIYYGFFNFKKTQLKANEFSNYKGSGILSTLGALIVVIAAEMIGIHVLTAKWNTVLAWTLTALSFYSVLQIIGIIRSVPKRPIAILENSLQLRFGILSNTQVLYESIEKIEIVKSSAYENQKGKHVKTLSLLGELEHSNICIHMKSPQHLDFIYGKSKVYNKLFLFVDDHSRFKSEVESRLSQNA